MGFGFLIDLAVGGAEDAVDKLGGIIGAEGFGELDGFVDGDFGGNGLGGFAEFIEAHAQDVAVDGGNGRERPLGSERLQKLVERCGTLGDIASKGVDEFGVTEGLGIGLDVLRDDGVDFGGGITGFLAKFVFV